MAELNSIQRFQRAEEKRKQEFNQYINSGQGIRDNVKLGDSEFEIEVADRLGPLSKGVVEADVANYVGLPTRKRTNLEGFYVPPEASERERQNYANKYFTDRTTGKKTYLPFPELDNIYALGTQANPNLWSHEFRHRYNNMSNYNSFIPEEESNRLDDLITARNKDEWAEGRRLYKDYFGKTDGRLELFKMSDEDVDKEIVKKLGRPKGTSGSKFNNYLNREYSHDPSYYPNPDKLLEQDRENNKFSRFSTLIEPESITNNRLAKEWRAKNLYINQLFNQYDINSGLRADFPVKSNFKPREVNNK